mmetsp:Transcript_15413/g.26981  ORF Transcript_15413/g.26981 Transcript_15413/m.26981 type:complete len:423 (+) Transcript_15413:50-1318(+)|eukprot:CAMPEP_0197665216 /NCGR_PEP_ID=MMETSP1338-20131121/59096_1 /TAXON_ID=43686 ORGANISM="Pelagodinium beii, Strain RCC1491" /NCGR_SAMPLE_ID=MMETSP1338 /ASSEMBLY_ACC=CAM_ASM_000754 /LENGTH=422 /DNA_ID=CAMNT_0043243989 /DNA_START=50 /DNA_END=1318 /DNA_ORIENTATION=-
MDQPATGVTTKPLAERLGYPKILRGFRRPEDWKTKNGVPITVSESRVDWLPDDWGQGISSNGRSVYVDPDGVIFYHKSDALPKLGRGSKEDELKPLKKEKKETPKQTKKDQPEHATEQPKRAKTGQQAKSRTRRPQHSLASTLARMEDDLEGLEAAEAAALEAYEKARAATDAMKMAMKYAREQQEIKEPRKARKASGSSSSSSSPPPAKGIPTSASRKQGKRAFFPLRSSKKGVKQTIAKKRSGIPMTREQQIQWLKTKLTADGYKFEPTPDGWPADCYPDPGCFVSWLPQGWRSAKQLTSGNKWLPAYVSPQNKRFFHKDDVEKHLGGKKLKATASIRDKPRKPVQQEQFPDDALIAAGNLENKSPYIQKRCQALAGKTVKEALKTTYKNAAGKNKRYGMSDLKYDKMYKNIIIQKPGEQ